MCRISREIKVSGSLERWSIGQVGPRLDFPDPSISRFVFLDREGVGPQKPDNILTAPSEQVYSPDKDSETKTAVGIELFRALPVPSQDVPIAEILEFKRKRWDELLRFRHAMDGLYDKAINSPRRSSAPRCTPGANASEMAGPGCW